MTMNTRRRMQQVSGGETYDFDLIPFDMVMNIFSRLSYKSLAKCRCVSKRWSSIIRRPNYNQLFPIKPSATPRLLFAFGDESNLFFYSSPQPQDLDDVDSSFVATRHHTNLGTCFSKLCRPVLGLVCSKHTEKKFSWAVISNPITGEYVTTPKAATTDGNQSKPSRYVVKGRAEYSFGYDPIDKEFKVLRITWLSQRRENWYARYHVLTLGTGNDLLWRKIQCCTLHYPLLDNGICINGVLYYPAKINNQEQTMVCFDVRSEKFSFINLGLDLATEINKSWILINYKGKLGACSFYIKHDRFELWVLEDAERHEWSKQTHIYQTPLNLNEMGNVGIAGMIGSGEIVLYTIYTRDPFVFYFNLERNIITGVRVLSVSVVEQCFGSVYAFSNYVEDVKLM